MNAEDILDIIGDSPDKYVRDAREAKSARFRRRVFNAAVGIAACLILAPTVIFGGMLLLFGRMGASAPAPGESGGGDDAALTEYMSYAGPVLPLTALENCHGIEVERLIDISFAAYSKEGLYPPSAAISDSYILTNSSTEDISLTAVYPYAASYREAAHEGLVPELYIDGSRADMNSPLVFGVYSGGFVPVTGAEDDPEMSSANLSSPRNFADYEALLSNGSYLTVAFSQTEALDQPVTVYHIGDFEYSSDSKATNPTLNFSFTMDESKTQVFTWNFNGGSNDPDRKLYERCKGGIMVCPNASPENIYPDDGYIIVVGEDISDMNIQGYRNGACEKGDELPDLACSVNRYESTLGEVFRQLLRENMPIIADSLYPIAARELLNFGLIGDSPATRYSDGMLDGFVYDVMGQKRICYFYFPITIPAGESKSIELKTTKEASYNYHGTGEDASLNGYEMATVLGSCLDFSSQRASISNFESIEIASQNFGFDIESGLTEVELDSDVPNYWLNIRKKALE